MRGSSLVLLVLTSLVVGCNSVRDAFTPRADVVARANDQTLGVERLAGWASGSKQVPLEPLAFNRLANIWVDYALFAQAIAHGQDLRDSATMTAAMWPVVSQIKWERFHDKLSSAAAFTDKQVDSAYDAGQVRMFQHILFQVPPNAAANVDTQKRRQAEQLLAQARSAGAGFGRLASRLSDDPGSKTQGGSLGVSARGQFVQPFEDAAWQLPPGGVSPVVKSPFGYHIIRRPPLAEVRDSFRNGVAERRQYLGDSLYLDSLSIKRRIEPVSRAPAYVRAAMQDLEASRKSGRTLVNYRGGSIRVRDLVRWMGAMDPSVSQQLPQAPDEQINQFLKALAQRELLLKQADSAKVTLTPEDWQQIRVQHDTALKLLGSILSLSPEFLRDSVSDERDRVNLAMGRVDDYMSRVVQGRARFFPVPPFLGETLRERGDWNVDEAGVRRALERAQLIRADSLRATGASPGGAPQIAPAPGPAPIDTTQRKPR
ncbi:MAG TPA: peptidylprolyl isomerase [Gemmatimonadales bacterium]|nr:peptidylprolyl isomerase [Gemmatimonadales bacterium]